MIWLFFYVYGSLAALQPLYWAATQPRGIVGARHDLTLHAPKGAFA